MNSGTEWNARWYGHMGCEAVYCFDYVPLICYNHIADFIVFVVTVVRWDLRLGEEFCVLSCNTVNSKKFN
jgi:hypothetical protein